MIQIHVDSTLGTWPFYLPRRSQRPISSSASLVFTRKYKPNLPHQRAVEELMRSRST